MKIKLCLLECTARNRHVHQSVGTVRFIAHSSVYSSNGRDLDLAEKLQDPSVKVVVVLVG